MIIKQGSYIDDRPTTKIVKPIVIQNPQFKVFTKGEKREVSTLQPRTR